MRSISLPIFEAPQAEAKPQPARGPAAIDRSKPYASCDWLEQGIAFNRRSLNACLITHHGTGFPHLLDYNGGEVDIDALLEARAKVVEANQNGGHPSCKGCPHLVTKKWPQPKGLIKFIGVAQFSYCNIECNYCYLQTADPSVFSAGFDPYDVLPALEALARDGHLAPRFIVDWGGGEPTIYPEFDEIMRFVERHGGITWVHTNGTRLPKPIKEGISTKRIHILCSVDAGTRETWKLIKAKDLLDIVWKNLEEYIRSGCHVVLKYIMKEENSSEAELRAFLDKAVAIGAKELLLDIDYDYPNPSPAVQNGLQMLRQMAVKRMMLVTFGSTGAFYTPEVDVKGPLERATARERRQRIEFSIKNRLAHYSTHLRTMARNLRLR